MKHCDRPVARTCGGPRAFTLVELLVVIAIIAVLASLLLPALARGKSAARASQCLGQMRQVGIAVQLHADENDDEYPRSQHSAFANGTVTWGRSLAPNLGATGTQWSNLLQTIYHCPADRRNSAWSYGMNVYFELGPDDDYEGKPQTWRRTTSVPRPASTILFAENQSGADHIMPHFWATAADAVDVAAQRHNRRSNYTFADGHSEAMSFEKTYDPARGADLWHP